MSQQSGKPRDPNHIAKSILARLQNRFNLRFKNVRGAIEDVKEMIIKKEVTELDAIGDKLINNFVFALVRFHFPNKRNATYSVMESVLRSNDFLNAKYNNLDLNRILNERLAPKERTSKREKRRASMIEFTVGLITRNIDEDTALDFLQEYIFLMS